MHVPNLGVVLHVQCAHCKDIRQFTVGLLRYRIDDRGYLIDRSAVRQALLSLGYQGFDDKWVCGQACFEKLSEKPAE